MRKSSHRVGQSRIVFARVAIGVCLSFLLGLFLAASASANFEQVGNFTLGATAEQALEVDSLAVNASGAGGVPAGTVYGVSAVHELGIISFNAKGQFINQTNGFDGDGIAVDQATGDLYVLNPQRAPGLDLIQVYSPDGSHLIAEFGEQSAFAETIEEGPEKLHDVFSDGIAVNDSGVIYVSDENLHGNFEGRVMVFKPASAGDYEHYVYAGRSNDIGFSELGDPIKYQSRNLALDSRGNLYTASTETIYEFAPGQPASAICQYRVPGGGLQAMTVNPETGEVFYFSFKGGGAKITQLTPCNQQGEFALKDTFASAPKAEAMRALAFNPSLTYSAPRPAGVLYAGSEQSIANGVGEEGHGYIFAPAEARDPVVESESVSTVTATTSSIAAQINPKGSATRYVFQYLTAEQYEANGPADRFAGASEAPLGGGEAGAGVTTVNVGASLAGLTPDTEYRYRVVATSHCEAGSEEALCEGAGSAQAFRTFPAEALGLPDGRAWELVSPIQKFGGEVIPASPEFASCGTDCKPGVGVPVHSERQSSPDGEAVVYEGFPFSTTDGARVANEYISRRSPSGWQTTSLSPPLQGGPNGGFPYFNANLTEDVLVNETGSLSGEAPVGYNNLYAQPTSAPSQLTPLVRSEPPDRSSSTFQIAFAGASADFSRLFFGANDALTEATPFAPAAVDGGVESENLYESVGGQLQLVNVAPGNAAVIPGASFGRALRGPQREILVSDTTHAISEDGSRVFWSDEAGQLYVRENAQSTTAIPDSGGYLTASADGSEVLLSDGHIYDLDTGTTTDLTAGEGGFVGLVGQTEDFSRLYFVDTAVLTGEEANDQGEAAQAGRDNLYAWDQGAVRFIAALEPADGVAATDSGGGDWAAASQERSAEASPDGRWVAFLSSARLTGYDNTGPCENGHAQGPCREVFLYDSATGKLACASCNRSGSLPLGKSNLAVIEGALGSTPQPRYLTDSGRLYFDSQNSLVPADTNHGVEDVYQYEPEGVGSCARAAGCVSLISAGHGPVDSNFLAADATGKNVFFATRDQLAASDKDELVDVYDAREGGGFASEGESSGGCRGEACQPSVTPPVESAPGSLAFVGAGNLFTAPSPANVTTVKTKSRPLSRAQKLAPALRACRKKPKKQRAACERTARRKYGKAKRAAHRSHR